MWYNFVEKIKVIIDLTRSLLDKRSGLLYADLALKAFGVAFVGEVGADLLRELGSENIAKSLECVAKLEILLLSVEPINALVDFALGFLGGT